MNFRIASKEKKTDHFENNHKALDLVRNRNGFFCMKLFLNYEEIIT